MESSLSLRADRAGPVEPPRAPRAPERGRVLDWLDDGLRRGERGRLEAEYPLALGEAADAAARIAFVGGEPAAHAALQVVEISARSRRLRVGLVGSVYTDPRHRDRGLARACVRACVDEARARSAVLAMLWSDLPDFYRRLGFVPAGRESLLGVDSGVIARAGPARAPAGIGAPRRAEMPALEALYRAKPVHVLRPPGSLARLAAAPDTRVVVARDTDGPAGYAALGRGDDFQGVVHEWAGCPDAVLACLAQLVRAHGPLRVLASPEPEACALRLHAAGAAVASGPLALAQLLDAQEIWRAIAPGGQGLRFDRRGAQVEVRAAAGSALLDQAAALDLLFGEGPAKPLGDAIGPQALRALRSALPWPLYLWGFDSI